MDKIKLLYVKNIISREHQQVSQQLSFFMLIENIDHDKQVDVLWAGEDEVWRTLAAKYHSMQGNDQEYWQADIDLPLTETQSLAGNIQFGLRYRVLGQEYWDNQQGHNYSSDADSGIMLTTEKRIQNIDFSNQLNQQNLPVTVAVGQSLNAEKVTIHWTIDDWKTTQETACQTDSQIWDQQSQSNARNPNQYGTQLWTGSINQGDNFKLQYILSCDVDGERIWDNNYGNNYAFQYPKLKILVLNLHCYQEENQDEKFTTIAQAINELDVDIVCLQEVAEYWRDGEGDWESNSAKIINDRLSKPFHLHTDWSHLGFDKYREGVAILSRYPLNNRQSKYVSESDDIYNIHSRKVVMAEVQIPYMGAVNVFSAHLSWLEDGFEQQFKCLHEWAESCQNEAVKATLLCGDFNITAGSSGYELVVNSKDYEDQFLAANDKAVFEKVFRVNDAHWKGLLADDYRIDYIFMDKNSSLQVLSGRVVFTDQDYGKVSDHCGYFMTFEPRSGQSF